MNFYHKIYNAVNEGILKALLIDLDLNDISINYSYHKIDNVINILPYYVKDLLNSDNINDILEIYNKIKIFYKKTKLLYKPDTLKELFDIFNHFNKYNINDNLSWIDFSNTVTVILKNNEEIPLLFYKSNALFIKFKNTICDHDIILHCDLKIAKNLLWCIIGNQIWKYKPFNYTDCIKGERRDLAEKDFDGYNHTYYNIDIKINNRNKNMYPAFQYCKKCSILNYEGYLPSIGELRFLFDYLLFINFILTHIIKSNPLLLDKDLWQSSTEYSSSAMWYLNIDGPAVTYPYGSKDGDHYYTLPLFKINN